MFWYHTPSWITSFPFNTFGTFKHSAVVLIQSESVAQQQNKFKFIELQAANNKSIHSADTMFMQQQKKTR